jgi:putative PIN family toxin of toxin-antitoxin system
MRITLDANVLVRATTRSHGPARELLEAIRSDPRHTLILSRHILGEVKRTLQYPRLQKQFGLSEQDIAEHVELLQLVSTVVEPIVSDPVVRNDPDDDAVVYTAVEGHADVLCTLDTDFYTPEVIAFCRQRGIEIMSDADLLGELRQKGKG